MIDFLLLVARHALLLAAGATILLAVGCVFLRLSRSPVHRQRAGELTLIAVLAWLVLACVPLPRLSIAGRPFQNVAKKTAWEGRPTAQLPLPSVPEAASVDTPSAEPDTGEFVPGAIVSDEFPPIAHATAEFPIPSSSEPSFSERVPVNDTRSDSTYKAVLPALPFMAYAAGACGCALWLLVGHVLLLRVRCTAQRPPPWLAGLLGVLAAPSRRLPPQLIVSGICSRPLSWGVLWPVIVLPKSLCRRENEGQLRTVLLHELGHIVQGDAWGNLLVCLAFPLLYWHPLYWWLRGQMQLAAELVVDDWAARQIGKETYVQELVALAKTARGGRILPLLGVTGVFSSPSQFYRRMQMLLSRETSLATAPSTSWRLMSLCAFGSALALATLAAGMRPAPAQQAGDEKPPPVAEQPGATETPPATKAAEPRAEDPQPTDEAKGAPKTPLLNSLNGVLKDATVKTLKTEKAELLDRIKKLQDRLEALEGRLPANATAAPPSISAQLPGGEAIYVPRIDENGATRYELIQKTPPAGAPPSVRRDGKTIVLLKEEDGNRWLQIYELKSDGQPGKLIETRRLGNKDTDDTAAPPATSSAAKPKPQPEAAPYKRDSAQPALSDLDPFSPTAIAPRAQSAPSDLDPFTAPPTTARPNYPATELRALEADAAAAPPTTARPNYPATARNPAAEPGSAGSSSRQLDLVSLATSYADAVGALESAKANLADLEPLAKTNAISTRELSSARLALQNAQRKEQLLRRIAAVAVEGAKHDLEYTSTMIKKGYAPASAQSDAQSRLDILEQILGTQAGSETKPEASNTPPRN